MKKFLRLLVHEFVFGAHLVSLGASGIILTVILIFNLPVNILPVIIGYLIMQVIYRYNHFRELEFDANSNPERVRHLTNKKRWVKVAPFFFSALLATTLLFTNWITAVLVIYIVIVGILYTEYFKALPVLGFKNYYASHFWAALVLIIPFCYNLSDMAPYWYLFIFIFIRGVVNTVFFDLKDIKDDGKRGIKTYPVVWGKNNTIYILQVINLLSIIPLLVGVYLYQLPLISLLLAFTIVFGIFYLSNVTYLNEKKLRLFSYIFIDGEYIFWPLLILIKLFI